MLLLFFSNLGNICAVKKVIIETYKVCLHIDIRIYYTYNISNGR